MAKRRIISAARAELFELFDEVTARDGAKVIIEHRTSPKRAVLVSEAYLDQLERVRRASTGSTFTLFGSATLAVPAEKVLESVREEQHALGEEKLRSFAVQKRPRTK
jgi:hypothetical protein